MGRTEDGRGVVGGWFPLVNSEGIPLEVVLGFLEDQDLVPDWTSFIEDAIQCGWNLKSLRVKIETAVGDVYGTDHREETLKRYDYYINTRK